MAERGGFEPPIRLLTVYRFSKPAPSATRPSLQNQFVAAIGQSFCTPVRPWQVDSQLRAQHPPRGKYQENRAARKSDIYYIDEKCPADLRVSFSRRASLFKSEKAEHSQNNCGGNEENADRMTFFHVACIANFSTT